MNVRVAMRHVVRKVDDLRPRTKTKPRYMRLIVHMELPSKDEYLQKVLSTAARATGSIPFIRRTELVETVLDLPTSLDQRRKAVKAIKNLPFVTSVYAVMGPPIR